MQSLEKEMGIWIAVGVIGIASLLISFKISRRKSVTIEEYRKQRDNYFREQMLEMQQASDHTSLPERLVIVRAGIADILRIYDNPEGFSLQETKGREIELQTPKGLIVIDFIRRDSLASTVWENRRKRCGSHSAVGIWRVRLDKQNEDFPDTASLMQHLDEFIRGGQLFDEEKPEFSRRFLHPVSKDSHFFG